MQNRLKGLGVTTWMVLGILASTAVATAGEQGFTGEVVRVGSDQKQVIMIVPDGGSAEGRQVTVLVNKNTRLEGVQDLSELKGGSSIRVEAKKSWYTRQWVAQRLVYAPSEAPRGMSSTNKAQLHDMENKFAQGQMGDIEFETKRQVLDK